MQVPLMQVVIRQVPLMQVVIRQVPLMQVPLPKPRAVMRAEYIIEQATVTQLIALCEPASGCLSDKNAVIEDVQILTIIKRCFSRFLGKHFVSNVARMQQCNTFLHPIPSCCPVCWL